MIQRIQTVWMALTVALVISGVLLGGLRPVPLWFAVISGMAALVPFAAIFIYKNRPRQISMLIANFVMLAGCAGFSVYYAWFAHTAWAYSPLFLFAALITNWQGLRGVLRDEMLVRTSERLR